ncbi:MAG: class I tRNA ligase family protein [Phycisphaerae bacterium]
MDRPEAAGSVVEGRADDGSEPRISLLVWTTTPWTLPSNMFAAVHRDFDYAVVVDEETGERLILAAALVESIAKKVKKTSWKVVSTCKGRDLVGLRYLPPYEDYHRRAAADFVGGGDATPLGEYRAALVDGGQAPVAWRVVAADFVTLDAGTGLVHEAPAFGEVDFDLYRQERSRFENPESIPLLCAVGPEGVFTDDVAAYAGRWVKACDKDICRELRDRGLLLHQEQYRHDYPFCWRAEEDPLIQYPRRSWFIRTTRFKEAMLENNASIRWLPEHIKTGRFGKFLESNVDWSLSRERYWGTPLPIWVCDNDACGYREAVDSYDGLTSKPGAAGMEVWGDAKRKSPELSDHLKVHKPYIDAVTYGCSKCGTGTMRRVPEVIDCWYDSGAMPFAQWGWPHRNQEMFESQFPADFISEALDQTRGWFYSLVAISTMLFGKEGVARSETRGLSSMAAPYPLPFRNCIVLGLLMGEDGLKMSKSKKNYKDPTYIFEREGADAMRWLFLSGQAPWTSIRFQESAIAEGQREFLIRLYNCYSFFVIYANIDKWTPEQREGEAARSELDRWIVSGLDACCLRVYDCMETYDNFGAARALVEFVDGLSNWYVRRNRDRFWRAGMDADKRAAYTTLYDCLVTLCKLIAPFTPFLAESMYQNLVRTQDVEAAVSVHLCDYPVVAENRGAVADRIDETLNEQIAMVRQLVSCGRAARSAAKLRVRQPLAGIELYHCQAEVIRRYEQIVRQELNVKRIDYVSGADIDRYVHYEIKPDFKKIGPKHGPLAPKIKAALAGHSDVDGLVKQLERDQACVLDVDGRSVELTSDELIVELHAREGWSAERIPGRGILALDTQLTPALRDEGSARDLVNQVQQVRKSLDLRYEQRIDLGIAGDEDIERVVNVFGDTIKGETLAQQVSARPIANIEPVRSQVDGHDVAIYVHPL